MRSRTYNAIITKSYDALSQLFFPKNRERVSFDNFLRENRGNRDLLALAPGSAGFVELDVNFPTGDKSRYVSLTLVDTAEVSEFFVVDRHPTDGLILDKLNENQFFGDNTKFEEIITRSKSFYLSFGVGDDVRTWSGPYHMRLVDAKLTLNSDGVKEVTLSFTPNIETIKTFTNLLTEDASYAQLESSFNSKDVNVSQIKTEAEVYFQTAGDGKKIPKAGYRRDPSPRWNYWVRGLVRQYIANLFTSVPVENILVLFSSDLDKDADNGGLISLKNYNLTNVLYHSENLSKLGISITPATTPPIRLVTPPGSLTGTLVNDTTKSRIIKNITGEEGLVNRSRKDLEETGIAPAKLRTPYEDLFDSEVPSAVGKENLYPANVEQRAIDAAEEFMGGGIPNEEDIGRQLLINPDQAKEKDKDIPFDVEWFKLSMVQAYDPKGDNTKFNQLLGPLYTFVKRLKEKRTSNLRFTFFEEHDVKILNFLKSNGIIEDAESPVILFGEEEIIQKLIYPTTPFRNNPEPQRGENGLGSALTFPGKRNTKDGGLIADFKTYSEDYHKEFYTNRSRTSSFGERIDLGPYQETLENNFNDADLVFMHNVKNSNVLDVSFNNKAYLRTLLMLAADSEDVLQAQNAQAGEILKERKVTYEKIVEYIRRRLGAFDKATNKTVGVSVSKAKLLNMLRTDEHLVNLVWQAGLEDQNALSWVTIVGFLVAGDELPKPGTKLITNGRRGQAYSDMLEDLNSYTVTANIRTLPFFNHPQLFERRCFLFGLQNNILGSVRSGKENYTVYTGRYKVIRTRHYMSTEDAFSEFDLVRDDLVTNLTNADNTLKMHTLGELMTKRPPPAAAVQAPLDTGVLGRAYRGTVFDQLLSPSQTGGLPLAEPAPATPAPATPRLPPR